MAGLGRSLKMIRPAEIKDAASIAEIHIDAWRHAYEGIVPKEHLDGLGIDEKTLRWKTILEKSQADTFVMESQGEISGWISYGQSRGTDCDETGEIWGLYVSPRYWRKGVGGALMNHVEGRARGRRKSTLTLWVLERNQQGRRFYENAGYRPDRATKMVKIGKKDLEEIRYKKGVKQNAASNPDSRLLGL